MPKRILVVDDEQNFLELVMRILSKRGFDVKTALNGDDALKLLEQQSFDLALLDIKMGPMNGIQLLEEIKERQPLIKAIMMTAYPTNETRVQAMERGASAYLTKPVELDALIEAMNSLLPQ
jgi:DNA-binding NtrC family response regulator